MLKIDMMEVNATGASCDYVAMAPDAAPRIERCGCRRGTLGVAAAAMSAAFVMLYSSTSTTSSAFHAPHLIALTAMRMRVVQRDAPAPTLCYEFDARVRKRKTVLHSHAGAPTVLGAESTDTLHVHVSRSSDLVGFTEAAQPPFDKDLRQFWTIDRAWRDQNRTSGANCMMIALAPFFLCPSLGFA